jgi:hypothetical protein
MTGSPVDVNAYWQNGYTIVRNVYSAQEIARFREGVLASRRQGRKDLLANPLLRNVIVDGRLVDIARKILGREDIVY